MAGWNLERRCRKNKAPVKALSSAVPVASSDVAVERIDDQVRIVLDKERDGRVGVRNWLLRPRDSDVATFSQPGRLFCPPGKLHLGLVDVDRRATHERW